MLLKLIACKVLQRELAGLIFESPNIIDVTMVRQQYHEAPYVLRQMLQREIDLVDSGEDPHTNHPSRETPDAILPEAILLGYGLCSNGVAGLSSKKYPLVIPRAHDCITLLLGSKERYLQCFNQYQGSFFYSRGWVELGVDFGNFEERLERLRVEYMDKYEDEDTVEYLLDMERMAIANYHAFTYIGWPGLEDGTAEQTVRRAAGERQWDFYREEGDRSLLKDFLDGNWDEERFLVVPPGEVVAPSYDEGVIRSGPGKA